MEFLPRTQAALDEYLTLADGELDESLMAMADAASTIVPDCVGLSLCLFEEELTFTLVAGDPRVAELDAMQFLDGLPRATAVLPHEIRDAPAQDPLDEEEWLLFAQASAASGIASTLSFPLLEGERVVGDINLYASTAEAFPGHHQELADALGTSALGAVTNADLEFWSRRRAVEAPHRLRDRRLIDVATGILAAREQVDVDTARDQLTEAARGAGVTDVQAAQVLIQVHRLR